MRYNVVICVIVLGSLLPPLSTAQEGTGERTYTTGRGVHVVPAVMVKRTLDAVFSIPIPSTSLRKSSHESFYRYRVRVGTFAVKQNATRLKERLDLEGYSADIRPWVSRTKGQLYTVSVGDYASAAQATKSLNEISKIFSIRDVSLAATK